MTRGRNKPRTRIIGERVSQAPDERGRRARRTAMFCKHGRARWRWCFPCQLDEREQPPALRFTAKSRRPW